MRRALVATVVVGVVMVVGAGPALACGGLIGRNGAVNLERTTTLAAYKDGVEHYVTVVRVQRGGRRVRLDRAPARRAHQGGEGRGLDPAAPASAR